MVLANEIVSVNFNIKENKSEITHLIERVSQKNIQFIMEQCLFKCNFYEV